MMKPLKSPDGNIFHILDGRSIDPLQMPYPYSDQDAKSALQMHSSLVQRLSLEKELEGHQGCVNALAWNSKGSLLVSGSDDARVNIWSYASKKLLHSIDTGHSANIFCCKFIPGTGDDLVASGAGDAEVRVFRLSRPSRAGSPSEQTAVFRCHSRRVKKLAVEDGNPHVVWSASEDGTLRQHDFREKVLCPPAGTNQECRNVLLDLRSAAKKSLADPPRHILALKSCDISASRPHQLLVGGSDAFARLYDRRMLPPLSSSRKSTKPPPCVCYFCPAHLSDYGRSSLHLTHVTFSPNGEEILLSYSGEHVYLMDVNNAQDSTAKYVTSDVSKRTILAPVLNGTKGTVPLQPIDNDNVGSRRASSWLKECRELLEDAQNALNEGKPLYAIEATSEILDAGRPILDPTLKLDCLCTRAMAFLKRSWKNDTHMAIRDCNEALNLNPISALAHSTMADALSQQRKHKEALDYAMRANLLDPTDNELAEKVHIIRKKLDADEDAKKK
uniref:Anaphase-promoting complex subunit 4 WD40 domain-containing protein n=1 Tax=Araucaria cunninghamii TaxID=56994 RepID=A0A0D6QXS2_ARACU